MRGLPIRVDFAKAKVLDSIDSEASKCERAYILVDANALGFIDFCSGCQDAPAMFQDEPELLRAWQIGWADANAGEQLCLV